MKNTDKCRYTIVAGCPRAGTRLPQLAKYRINFTKTNTEKKNTGKQIQKNKIQVNKYRSIKYRLTNTEE